MTAQEMRMLLRVCMGVCLRENGRKIKRAGKIQGNLSSMRTVTTQQHSGSSIAIDISDNSKGNGN